MITVHRENKDNSIQSVHRLKFTEKTQTTVYRENTKPLYRVYTENSIQRIQR
jgi:hypothetical protein